MGREVIIGMKTVQLQAGHFAEGNVSVSELGDSLEKDALLVYCGTFQSMDGEVDILDDHLKKLASNHNSWLSKFKRMASGEIPAKACPPIQLDHSKSARDTVGRLVGDLKLAPYKAEGGEEVLGLYGRLKILGKENVEKVKDGRWTHLSIGADLEEGKLTELTITPFPAAPEAAMLSRTDPQGRSKAIEWAMREAPKLTGAAYRPDAGDDYILCDFETVQQASDFADKAEATRYFQDVKIDRHSSGANVRLIFKKGMSANMRKGDVVTTEYKGYKIGAVQENVEGEDSDWSCFVSKGGRTVYELKDTYQNAKDATDEAKREIDAGNVKMTGDSNIAKDAKESEMADDKNLEGDGEQSGGVHIDIQSHNEEEEEGEEQMTEEQKAEQLGRLKKHLMESQGLSEVAVAKRMKYMGEAEMKRLTEELNQHTVGLEEKIKKHLIEEYGHDEKEAAEKMKQLTEEDRKELASDADAKAAKLADVAGEDSDKDGDKKKLANQVEHKEVGMSADAKKKLVELVGDFRKAQSNTTLAAKKQAVHTRLSALKAEGKITPAEIKGLDIVKLASSSDEALTLALETYSKREPQVLSGMYGTVHGEAVIELKRLAKKNAMAKEMLQDMKFTSQGIKMSAEDRKELEAEEQAPAEMEGDSENTNELSAELSSLCTMMDDAEKKEEVKERMRKLADRLKQMGAMADDKAVGADSAAEMESAVKEMCTKFDGLMTLVGPVLGLNDNAK